MTMPFVSVNLETFHSARHPIILVSYLDFTFCYAFNHIWTGANGPRIFAKYLINGSSDLHQTL